MITARAVAPVSRALDLFLPALKQGSRVLLYKGPDAEAEIREAEPELRKAVLPPGRRHGMNCRIRLGARTMVEMASIAPVNSAAGSGNPQTLPRPRHPSTCGQN